MYKNEEEELLCFMDSPPGTLTSWPNENKSIPPLIQDFLDKGYLKLTCYPQQYEITKAGASAGWIAHQKVRKRNQWPVEEINPYLD